MGTLEVHNVKRAINRYGTLPKGARIGAYLESLRQSGLTGEPPDGVDLNDASAAAAAEDVAAPKGHASLLRQAVSNRAEPAPPVRVRGASSGGFLRTDWENVEKRQDHVT